MSDFRISVVNIGGRDSNQFFSNGAGHPNDAGHSPVNYHAYAACSSGAFLQDFKFTGQFENFIFLIRSDLSKSLSNLKKLRKQKPNSKIALMFKETGPYQLSSLFDNPKKCSVFRNLISLSNGILSPTPFTVPFYKNFTDKPVGFIPTPYPIQIKEWDFSVPFNQKTGIYLATREFDVNWRMHVYSLGSLRKWIQSKNVKLTVVNQDGKSGEKWLGELGYTGSDLNIINGQLSYSDHLKLLGKHRVIVNPDLGMVPGQIVGDSLLVKTPVVGGNSLLQDMLYPELVTKSMDYDFIVEKLDRLYFDEIENGKIVGSAIEKAELKLSFGVVCRELETFFKRI